MRKKFDEMSGAEACKSCRSRQELSMSLFLNLLSETDSYSNEYLLAKFGFDAAENEPLESWNLDGNLEIWTGEHSYSNFQISVGIGDWKCGASLLMINTVNACSLMLPV